MNKLFTLASIATLVFASSAFADDQSTSLEKASKTQDQASTIIAFQDIESAPVAANEMETAGAWMIRYGKFCISNDASCALY